MHPHAKVEEEAEKDADQREGGVHPQAQVEEEADLREGGVHREKEAFIHRLR